MSKVTDPARANGLWLLAATFQLLFAAGCNQLLGFDDFSLSRAGDAAVARSQACTTNRECTDRASRAHASDDAGSSEVVPAICVHPQRRCVELLSEDCTLITGDYLADDAVVIGSLFSLSGSQAATNLARQQSAILAVEEIDAAGGLPQSSTSTQGRPLVMLSCDEAADLQRAGEHLVRELALPAIVGPNTSQDTLDLSTMLTIEHGTLVISPTAVASSISDLLDDGLTWLMVPSDEQRAPLMLQQIDALETRLHEERGRQQLKLGVIFRDDALGIGTRASLNQLSWNGKALSDSDNLGENVHIDGYAFAAEDQQALVQAYASFVPDVLVLAGTAEAVTRVMVPLEAQWSGGPRPEYVLIDSVKVPELLSAVSADDDLRARVRGTGVTPSAQSAPVYNAFKVDYGLRFPGGATTISGMGPSYDATYALAYALAATQGEAPSGAAIAGGLRRLSGGVTVTTLESTKILAAFHQLAAGQSITAIGTFGPLSWDQNGAALGGTLEVWCVGIASGKPAYQSSGLTYEVTTGQFRGEYAPCAP